MRSILMMRMIQNLVRVDTHQLTIDDVQDEQDSIIGDEVTEDSTEQLEPKQYPCDECKYDAKYLNNILAQHEGTQGSLQKK